MQLDNVAIALRPRSAWESIDLGVGMLQRWWRSLYAAFAAVYLPVAMACAALGWATHRVWLGLAVLWWLKPLFDRVALHVLSRAVFGESLGVRRTLLQAPTWLATGLPWALTFGWIDMARSFHLPVAQLEGQRGRAARARLALLGRRAHGYAVWLTLVCLLFTLVLIWSFDMAGQLLVPAAARDGDTIADVLFEGAEVAGAIGYADFAVAALAVLAVEPLYVAAGFALYLNRRTHLEGWDLEVALRRMAARRAAPAGRGAGRAASLVAALAVALAAFAAPPPAQAADKDPRREIAEVLKAPEFAHERQVTRWRWRSPEWTSPQRQRVDLSWLEALGFALARVSEVVLWVGAIALIGLALWWGWRLLPREPGSRRAAYRPPAALFGMALAPETLPADLPGAVRALLAAGRVREALALLYRGTLSALVHAQGVPLRASDTEGEALARVRERAEPQAARDFAELVALWQAAAYARRLPAPAEVERLAAAYAARFPREAAA
ncbi:MAG TPA: DUF4129 domain-containing protein [Burkholderiales bacterium]|nr:DUF4129 domain-containing protein [Burkholderiales bacterium]